VRLDVALTNAALATAADVSSVDFAGTCGTGASVSLISQTASAGTVSFLLSGVQDCEVAGTEGVELTLSVRPTGAGSVGVSAGFATELLTPLDGGTASDSGIISLVSGFAPVVEADTAASQLTLASSFRQFGAIGAASAIGNARIAQTSGTVYSDLAATTLDAAPVVSATLTVSGDFTGFGTGTGQAAVTFNGDPLTISGTSASITLTGSEAADLVAAAGATNQIAIRPGTSTTATANAILNASDYAATLTIGFDTGSGFVATTESATGDLDSVTREGETIIFPWTASAGTAAASGSNNVIRIGNTGSTAITGLFARVLSTSATGYTNPGLVSLGLTIPAGGEVLIDSALLQQVLGDFGRGDVEIVVEAPSSQITTRRLVVRPDGVFDWRSGRN